MKRLSCLFLDGVLCSFRKTKQVAIMNRCLKCPHYLRFMRDMAEEDERVMAEIDSEREFSGDLR